MAAGITADQVAAWGHLGASTDMELVTECADAVNAWVTTLPVVADSAEPATWSASVILGATMLAARLYHRRSSPGGVESFTDGLVYLPRRDSDVDLLLAIGRYSRPGVG
jgi:hypothetical protein